MSFLRSDSGFIFAPVNIGVRLNTVKYHCTLSRFRRDADYDFSMSACLHALHSYVRGVLLNLRLLMSMFSQKQHTGRSSELQVAMCNAYERIVEFCSQRVWKPEILLKLLFLPKPCSKLIECIRLVVDKFGQSFFVDDDSDI